MSAIAPILVTARDARALMAVVDREVGEPVPWMGPDDPRRADAVVWFASSAPPPEPYRMPVLRWIHSGWAGVDFWHGRPEWGTEVQLTRTVGDFPERIAAYVMAHLLADALDVSRAARQQEARRWERWVPGTLAGKSILIVGYGAIGRAVGRAARGLGMRVGGIRRGPITEADRRDGIGDVGELAARLSESDIVVNLLPATPATRRFWNAERLARLRSGATFVNVSRGSCVDEAALLVALEAGRPARAILDVFDIEPLPAEHPLWRSARVRVTPHVAGIGTPGAEGTVFAAQWARWCRKEPLEHLVDRERGY
jgi:phosphoglycerate dehydrogenase-like enzyme